MWRKAAFLLTAGLIIVAGCARSKVVVAPGALRPVTYSPADRVRVMQARDGIYGTTEYQGSGRTISARVIEALQRTHGEVRLLAVSDRDQAIVTSRASAVKYLVVPTILHWQDRANWAGVPDEVRIRLELYDVPRDAVTSAVTFEAASPSFSLVEEAPEALLDRSFERAVLVLFQTAEP